MADLRSSDPIPAGGRGPQSGFSLVEMLVALLFMSILMAGMAMVFKASISNMYTAGEKVSSSRRNRLAIDLLYEDVNNAGMFITDLTTVPQGVNAANPLFYILPNQKVTGFIVNGSQQYADQLFFYMDQPLPFLGKIMTGSTTYTNSQGVGDGAAPVEGVDNKFIVDCGTNSYASAVYNASLTGLNMVLMDQWEVKSLESLVAAPSSSDTTVTVLTTANAVASYTSRGATDSHPNLHNPGSQVRFYLPGQMVRYSVQMLTLDPNSSAGVPCLVRDQGTYSSSGFTASQAQQIIAENVTGFKVYISANPGYLSAHAPTQAWAPFTSLGNNLNLNTGWTNGVLADFNSQLATVGRADTTSLSSIAVMNSTYGNGLAWFRTIPAVLRLDITTQTATQRTEYSSTGKTLANASLTRSLVIEPRNFGLPLGN